MSADSARDRAPGAAPHLLETAEGRRLARADADGWRRWGPYLSERQWGTVREDYSANGAAWEYFPHDHARSRAYRWGEDGLAGFAEEKLRWCLGLALWNGRDPFLKERMFGLTNQQGNHGEDVKELWWYLDGTPTHSYMRMLYKYPQGRFPYEALVEENARRKGQDLPEYELIDTGIFAASRYFDVAVEYAKAAQDDILMRIRVENCGGEPARLDVLPQLWARNSWSWDVDAPRPLLRAIENNRVAVTHPEREDMVFESLQPGALLFCDNETNTPRLYGSKAAGHFKDAFHDFVVDGLAAAVNPLREGTKCAVHCPLTVPAGAAVTLRLRLAPAASFAPMSVDAFDEVVSQRIAEADEFYGALQQGIDDADRRLVHRQALAGMLWSKQYYNFDVLRWLEGDPAQPPPPPARRRGRDSAWTHLLNDDIISMPDKWEYPWYAAWDLAFHCVTLALVDPAFAKHQLVLLVRDRYIHPNGQLPAYEWNFGDVNPPVHAWAALRVYRMDRALTGRADRAFLENVFHKLTMNFTWWVNRKDAQGRDVFQGGFLGLDNIGIFDRSKPLPTGGSIDQSDGTAWMAMYALNLMRIATELAFEDPVYQDLATKFFFHFLLIADAMERRSGDGGGLWDETDQFYYDVLNLPDGERVPLRIRSLVGIIPLLAVEVLAADIRERLPVFAERTERILARRPDLASVVSRWTAPGQKNRLLLSLLRRHRMKALLSRMLDEDEFLSEFGIRSVSKIHASAPFVFVHDGTRFVADYEPGESSTSIFGGNSNWRGPVWMPLNCLLIEALYEFQRFYGDSFTVEYPTRSGEFLTLAQVAEKLAGRVTRLLLRDEAGRRPVLGSNPILQTDPRFKDNIPFHEYFHAETGQGLGASHQTGWTGLVAFLLQPRRIVPGAAIPVAQDGEVAPSA
jgi:hypothetical protein